MSMSNLAALQTCRWRHLHSNTPFFCLLVRRLLQLRGALRPGPDGATPPHTDRRVRFGPMDTSPDLPTRRPRVMVLFGGRSGEHAISCATAGGVLRAIDRDTLRRPRRRASRRPAGGSLADGRPRRVGASPTGGCRRWRTPPRTSLLPQAVDDRERPGARGRAAAPRCWARSTSSSRCCTARSARTARCRACSSWPTSATSAPGVLASAVGMDKHIMKLVLAAARAAGRAVRRRPAAASWTASPTASASASQQLGLPVFVKPARAGS